MSLKPDGFVTGLKWPAKWLDGKQIAFTPLRHGITIRLLGVLRAKKFGEGAYLWIEYHKEDTLVTYRLAQEEASALETIGQFAERFRIP